MLCRVSVAMASYNGEKYISQQIDSILRNLTENDELVISDDHSTDRTVDIVKSYMKKDSRVKLFFGPSKGIKANFTNAMFKCKGQYIFLSDQDDIWFDNKVDNVIPYLRRHDLVVHDCIVTSSVISDIIVSSFFKYRKSGCGVLKNIYKNTYIGCCMAFSRDLMKKALPIPNDIKMHDQWIGILNDIIYQNTYFLNEPLIFYRRHGNNASSFHHDSIYRMIKNRISLIKELFRRIKN